MSYISKNCDRAKRRGLMRFRRDETGSVAVEGIFSTLLLFGWLLASFQIYEAFSIRADATRSTYMIADMLSRQRSTIGPKYVNGLQKVFNYLTNAKTDNQTWLRVTFFKCKAEDDDPENAYCDGVNKKFTLIEDADNNPASYATPGADDITLAQPYTQAGLDAISDRLPVMAVGDMAVITETIYRFKPFLHISDVSLTHTTTDNDGNKTVGALVHKQGLYTGLPFATFVVTRPREPKLVWNEDS
ncbi:TadE/TadG family type IV pilus assembly protein [Thioclava sp.]|uniref:TadE/TadG family type IV pilus assembly protein n=1 Tax=Thioclava sp. TaxID=1933450 RepID=UPI003AA85F7B